MSSKRSTVTFFVRKQLKPSLNGYSAKGRLLYRVPVGLVLEGFAVEVSAFTKDLFHVEAFVQPLYCPTDYLAFTFGKRLGTESGGQERTWNLSSHSSDEIAEDVLRAMASGREWTEQIDTPEKLYVNIQGIVPNPRDPYVLQGIAYSSVLFNNPEVAKRDIVTLVEELRQYEGVPWCRTMREEAEEMAQMVKSDLGAVRERLRQNALDSAEKLKIIEALQI